MKHSRNNSEEKRGRGGGGGERERNRQTSTCLEEIQEVNSQEQKIDRLDLSEEYQKKTKKEAIVQVFL